MTTHALALALLLVTSTLACDKKPTSNSHNNVESDSDEDDGRKHSKTSAGKTSADPPAADPSASSSLSARTDLPALPLPPASAATSPAHPLLAGYTLYSTAAGGYELLMPPSAKESEFTLKDGKTIQHRVSATKGSGQDLLAYWQEMGGDASPTALGAARDAGVGLLEAPTVKPVKVGSYDGFDVWGKPKSGDNKVMHLRMFIAKQRLFGLIDTDLSDAESQAWMSSFKFSDGSASNAGPGQPGTLSRACEDYWAKSRRCNANAVAQVPEGPAKEQIKKAMDDAERQTREAWKGFSGDALDNACKSMIEALKSNPNCKD